MKSTQRTTCDSNNVRDNVEELKEDEVASGMLCSQAKRRRLQPTGVLEYNKYLRAWGDIAQCVWEDAKTPGVFMSRKNVNESNLPEATGKVRVLVSRSDGLKHMICVNASQIMNHHYRFFYSMSYLGANRISEVGLAALHILTRGSTDYESFFIEDEGKKIHSNNTLSKEEWKMVHAMDGNTFAQYFKTEWVPPAGPTSFPGDVLIVVSDNLQHAKVE